MRLSKHHLESILEDVVFPFEKLVFEDVRLGAYLQDENSAQIHNLAIAKLTLWMFNKTSAAYEIIEKGVSAHKKHEVSKEYLKEYYGVYFRLCHEWLAKHFDQTQEFEKKIAVIETYVFDAFKSETETKEQFFDFDSQRVNEDIKRMHYKDEEKITALEMFEQEILTSEDIADILESNDDLHELILDEDITYDVQYFTTLSKYVSIYATMFEKTLEFRDIGFSLNNLANVFDQNHENISDPKNITNVGIILKSIIEDLVFWTKAVLIEKTAIDIHYVDASLLANITQFELMFSGNEDSVEENEVELF